MINFIIGSTLTLISILIGYYLGKGSSIIPEETRKQVKKLIQALPIDKGVGAIPRPTAQQLKDWDNPLIQAEKEEMSKTFSKIVPE